MDKKISDVGYSVKTGCGFIRTNNLHRKNIRLKNYNYKSNGYYFVTICTKNNKDNIARYQETVKKNLLNINRKYEGIEIDYYVLMPNQIHLILIFNNAKIELGEVIRRFKAFVTKECSGLINQATFWQRNYYEHVIRNEEALLRIREYIKNNPLEEKIDFNRFYRRGLDKSSPYNKSSPYKILKETSGIWKDENHPELKEGTGKFVGALREESDKRNL